MIYLIKCTTKLWNGRLKFIFILSIIIILSMNCTLTVFSNENIKSIKDLSMSELSGSNTNIEFITTEYDEEAIECYSVGKNNIAIGLKNYINIYNLDGMFLYGIKFSPCSSYFLEYESDNLYIYIHRSSKCIKIMGFEKPILYYSVNDTKSNYDIISYKLNNVLSDTIKNSITYKVKGISGTKLVKIDKDNMETVIYDSTSNVGVKFILIFIGIVIFAFVVLYNIKNHKNVKIE